jgi:hypothetical protein
LSVKSCARRNLCAACVHFKLIRQSWPMPPRSRVHGWPASSRARARNNGRGPIERASVEMEELQKESAPKPAELIRLRSLSNLLEIVRAKVWTDVA